MDNSKIKSIIRKIIEKYRDSGVKIGDDALLTSIGLDSLQTLMLLFDIENEFSIEMDISKITNELTINDLANIVTKTLK